MVVYDDLDLPFGQLRLAGGGGHGGHNGMRSIIATMGRDFFRVRVGIGRPHQAEDASRRVLGGFSRAEQDELPIVVGRGQRGGAGAHRARASSRP